MENTTYRNKWFRLLAALAGSLIIVFNGRPFDLIAALAVPIFYPAFIVNFLVALLLVHAIHKVTLHLDKMCPWEEDPIVRLSYQINLGLLAPAFIDVVIISIYFLALGQDIRTNNFFLIDFPIVILLLLIWNAYYCLHYMLLYLKHKRVKPHSD
ncbi:hypothetical protein FMM05_20220 [Flavobacterium zepuense]|uniref:Transmembrane protein n=1 Tax=Flavobacterium zepuense TaxID=2593302 RepID=A0A552UTD6_9FLAO|nr:hypothetical protein [Flavobacterium zepuense]TRW21478.1 hypothetical protein FMM05_20220 [Flavobacterium zepuense]